jgi:hypothetical protein
MERRGNAMEPGNQHWKPISGEWHNWRDSSGKNWRAVDILTSKEKEKVTFLCRRAPVEPTEHFRAILFSKNGKTEVKPLPYSVGGRQELDVYWYEQVGDKGSFLRLSDRQGEYLVNLRDKTTAMIVRIKNRAFVGELRKEDDDMDMLAWSVSGDESNPEVSVAGRNAKEISGPLATEKGKLIGKIRESGKQAGFYP